MKHALYASIQALQAYRRASWHQRVNLMTRYFESELPIIHDEMVKAQQEIEQLKARIKELEEERE